MAGSAALSGLVLYEKISYQCAAAVFTVFSAFGIVVYRKLKKGNYLQVQKYTHLNLCSRVALNLGDGFF